MGNAVATPESESQNPFELASLSVLALAEVTAIYSWFSVGGLGWIALAWLGAFLVGWLIGRARHW